MAATSLCSSMSFLFPPIPRLITKTLVLETLAPPKTLVPKPSVVYPSASTNRHGLTIRSTRMISDHQIEDEESPSSARIIIKGLSQSTSQGYLVKAFSHFGEVSRVKVITSRTFKNSLGLAYVWFTCEEDAKMAVNQMDGKFVDGRFISVAIAKPEAPTSQVRPQPYRF
ncbi:Glycine-rich RNA-binding protein 10 [Acorus calamus]|uniref:Glycine-rich RNA-binding protein 10 n=1 Tax=Acorus calamus TaxID=4465 RepID=A0AAV9CW06_ACOCL|nr:Glycine-rich RNA-binding protein 10 [Acorus calamus]